MAQVVDLSPEAKRLLALAKEQTTTSGVKVKVSEKTLIEQAVLTAYGHLAQSS